MSTTKDYQYSQNLKVLEIYKYKCNYNYQQRYVSAVIFYTDTNYRASKTLNFIEE